jgi:hypothetical protein
VPVEKPFGAVLTTSRMPAVATIPTAANAAPDPLAEGDHVRTAS